MCGISCYNPTHKYRKDNMDTNNKTITFKISYYAKKYKKFITRNGDNREGSITKTDKNGIKCFTYWDLDANGWRQATDMWWIK